MIVSGISHLNPGKKITVRGYQIGLHSNCGAHIISQFSAFAEDTRSGWGNATVGKGLTLEEIFGVLDSNKQLVLDSFNAMGFAILSDRFISATRPIDLKKLKVYTYDNFRTSDFVHWLISRKIGLIVSCPAVMNKNHVGSSAVKAWIWIKDPALLMDDEVKVYNNLADFKAKSSNACKAYPSLYKWVVQSLNDEKEWLNVSSDVAENPAKATSPAAVSG